MEDGAIVEEVRNKKDYMKIVKIFNDTFHKYGLWILISLSIGIYSGIQASKMYYTAKMQDSIKLGGLVFDQKPYQLIPK